MPDAYPFWLGGVAASMAAACTHPLDLTKVRMQTHGSSTRPSMFAVLRTSTTQSGLRSLYTGLSASLMRQMSYSLVRIGVYEKLKTKVASEGKSRNLHLLLAAGAAGGLGGLAGNPADIILVRMTSDSIIRKEGFKSLCRGIGTNTSRAILMNASQVGSYDFFKSSILQRRAPFFDYQFRDNLLVHVIASCLSGTVATTVCSPADVIRSRLMASSSDAKFAHVVLKSFQEEGIRFLFKGWTPAFARLGPNTVLLFVFFEQLKGTWKNYTT